MTVREEQILQTEPPAHREEGPGRRSALRAGVSGLLAVLAGAGLAIAPVTVSDTRVSWPGDGNQAESTVLLLTNQTPYRLDLSFDSSAGAGDGVLFATMDPERGDARQLGLVVSAEDGNLTVASGGREEEVPLPADASFVLSSDVDGMTLLQDDREVLSWPEILPPQVDALITTVDDPSVSAELQVVDDFNSSPTPAKVALMVLLWLALAYALFSLWQDDRDGRERWRSVSAPEARPWWRRLVLSDLAVVAVLVGWVFIGPMTDDDGYYANMALNYGDGGYVGNYYQMFNQSFTPFTWFWQLLYFWQELGGRSPVWLRLPALAAAVIAWFLTRSFFDRMMGEQRPWFRRAAHTFLALVYVSWWMPYAIGTRPEILGALGSALALVLVTRALERRTLLPAAFAAMAAGLAFAAHPTGGVAFAPVVLAVPGLWQIARRSGTIATAAARTAAVLSVGSVPLFAAFADGSLHDFRTGSARFAAVETPLNWTDEAARYALLLADIPMGAYAKRSVVLLALVALVWFAVVWLAARIRRAPGITLRFSLAGWSFAVALVALWVTTSKWSHHFGALSVLGPLLLTTVLFLAPRVVRSIAGERRLPVWLIALAVLSFIPPAVVALQGPNSWAYSWGQLMYSAWVPPQVRGIPLGSLALWLPLAAACIVGTALLLRRARRDWRGASSLFAAAAFAGVFFLVSTGFLYGTFAASALRGLSTFSVGAGNLQDPTGGECLVEDSVTLWDATRGEDLPDAVTGETVSYRSDRIPEAPAPEMLESEALTVGGWPAAEAPPSGSPRIWADSASGLAAAEETGWYQLPSDLGPDQRVTVMVGGAATDGEATGVIAQLGRITGDGVAVDRELWVTDAADRPGWRTLVIPVGPNDIGDDAVLRLVGVDGSTAPGSWFGFSAPRLVAGSSMSSYVQHGEPTLVSWQSSFWFPCQRPVRIADGVIEPPVMATTWADVSPDNIWVVSRGGALAGAARIATLSTPATEMVEVGSTWGRVVGFEYPYPTDGYEISKTPRTVLGLSSPFGLPSQLVEAERKQ